VGWGGRELFGLAQHIDVDPTCEQLPQARSEGCTTGMGTRRE